MNQLSLTTGVLLISAAIALGWFSRGWLEDSHRLTAIQSAQQAIDAAMARESGIAEHVEKRLAELQANERIIDRGIIREIQKPIYQRVCLEPDAIRLLNHAAAGTSADSTNTDDALPRIFAPAD